MNSSSSIGAPLSTMNATRTPSDGLFGGIRISRPASSEERSVKRDVRHSPDEIGNRRVRFEAHPLHAEFTFLVTDDKEFQMLQVGLPWLRFGRGDPDVVIPAHRFFWKNWRKILFYSLSRLNRAEPSENTIGLG